VVASWLFQLGEAKRDHVGGSKRSELQGQLFMVEEAALKGPLEEHREPCREHRECSVVNLCETMLIPVCVFRDEYRSGFGWAAVDFQIWSEAFAVLQKAPADQSDAPDLLMLSVGITAKTGRK